MKKYFLKSLCFFLMLFVAVNCKKPVDEPFLTLSEQALSFPIEGSTKSLQIQSDNSNWSVVVPTEAQSWVTTVKDGNTLKVTTAANRMGARQAILKISAGNLNKELKIQQLGSASAIMVDRETIKLDKFAADFTLVVTANVDYELNLPEWITEKRKEALSDGTGYKHTLSVSENNGSSARTVIVKVVSKNTLQRIEKAIVITQYSQYANDNTDAIEGDIKLKIVRGTASSQQTREEIEKSFDGDYNTFYHSNWTNTSATYFPINLEFFLENPENVEYMVYYPRTSGVNGFFKETEIWVSTETNPTYTKVKDFNFQGNGQVTRVTFDTPIAGAKSFKIVVKSGYGDGQGFASAGEIEFYKKNTGSFDPTSIFADATCSELKPGITDAEIEAISNPFYKNLAVFMKKGEYPTEFRIQEYRAWPNPNVIREANRMQYSYSNLDNPTGIFAEQGEELIVFVGPTHGRNIQIKIMNLDKPGGDGFDQASQHPLYQGVNKIKAGQKGLIYLQYQTADYASAPKIKVHFATGRVNGYYDKAKHTSADWSRLLNAAPYKYFDVIGENAHLCYETQSFKTHTGDRGKDLIDVYDDLVEKTHIFAGTVGNRAMVNRAYFQVMYHSFMYCTAYRTSYNVSTMPTLCNPTTFKRDIWGPAHEIGHSHQVPPTFLWIGMTEVTVNMNSMNIQTAWEQPTRLETESMAGEGGYNNRYEKAYNRTIVPKRPFAEAGAAEAGGNADVFCNLIPFWQINLYFSKVKNDPQFSVRLYEKMRTLPLKSGNDKDGEYQVDFTKSISELTNTNLIPFFEKWGFYKPINKEITDYVKRQLIVTDSYASQIKSQINGAGFPTITDKIEYICDSNWKYYRDKTPVVKGTATRSGNRVTTSGYQNVVAYEVYDTNNQLVFVSNKNSFDAQKDFTRVYAIAYNGDRTEVTF